MKRTLKFGHQTKEVHFSYVEIDRLNGLKIEMMLSRLDSSCPKNKIYYNINEGSDAFREASR